ncbi:MAG: DUF2314 domain-containing protein [Silicimonas sp.]|nr:DUF2314 domain-containing protein [Silicimonas sp.]
MRTDIPLSTCKRRGRILGLAMVLVGFASANSGPFGASAVARTGTFPAPEAVQKQQLSAAHAAAREHLDRFFQSVLGSDGVARKGAAVRVSIQMANGKTDLVWVTPFAKQNGQYFGTLSDIPRHSVRLSQGDLIRFDRAQVVDWSFFGTDGRMYGNFTTRMILNTVSSARAAEIAALLSDTAAPEDW